MLTKKAVKPKPKKRSVHVGKQRLVPTGVHTHVPTAAHVEITDIWLAALQAFDRALTAMMFYDHSISAPELGSLFRRDPGLAIGQMHRAIAEIFGAAEAWISTNGTTSANVLAMMATAQPGDTVIIQRDCHVSMLAGAVSIGLHPVYVEPAFEATWGINVGVSPAQLNAVLTKHPQTKAIFLTWPNYYGIAADLPGCVQVAEQHDIPLIVDNAHGSHFGFAPSLPKSALDYGAALVTQSIHKTCGALSQGSLVLFNDLGLLDPFYRAVNNSGLVSTSFSFPIAASVARAVLQLHEEGEVRLERAIAAANYVRAALADTPNLACLDARQPNPWSIGCDPLRVAVDVSDTGLTGYRIEELLIERFKIYPEMATLQHVLFLFNMAHGPKESVRVVDAMRTLAHEHKGDAIRFPLAAPPLPAQAMAPRAAYYAPRRRVPISEAVGLVSAESIACYPPGSAIVVMGEILSYEAVNYLLEARAHGATLKGASDAEFQFVEVIDG